MNLCRHCKEREGTLCDARGNNGLREYFTCNVCNAERARKYRKTKGGKESYRKSMRRQYIVNRTKVLARGVLNYNLRKGRIVKPEKCICGSEKVEAHHSNYSKPLDVLWLCRSCHSRLHKNSV